MNASSETQSGDVNRKNTKCIVDWNTNLVMNRMLFILSRELPKALTSLDTDKRGRSTVLSGIARLENNTSS